MGNKFYYWVLMIFVSLLMLTHHPYRVMGQTNNLYTCWGGCYNKCFLSGSGGRTAIGGGGSQYPCYFQCLSDCTFTQSSSSTENFQYYCQIGCSATRCVPLGRSSSDAAKMEKCVGGCDRICKI